MKAYPEKYKRYIGYLSIGLKKMNWSSFSFVSVCIQTCLTELVQLLSEGEFFFPYTKSPASCHSEFQEPYQTFSQYFQEYYDLCKVQYCPDLM